MDRNDAKRAAATALGATDFLLAGADGPASVRELTAGRGADYAFEAIGAPAVQEQCLHAVRPGGTVVLVGISPAGSKTNLPGAVLTRQEKTVMGCYYGTANTARDFPLYGDLFLAGRLNLEPLISKTYALDQLNEAYAELLQGGLARGVVTF